MKILQLEEIKTAVQGRDLSRAIERGFQAYSEGRAIIPPVGELLFDDPAGEIHIKYGYISGDPWFVIKIASGFAGNPAKGLPAGNGMMLLFDSRTGAPECILLDEGYLTDLRTAVAGAVVARYLAPAPVRRIGILGTGVQARMQLQYLKTVTVCREVCVFGRNENKLSLYRSDMEAEGFAVAVTLNAREVCETCNLIITTTSAGVPLLQAEWIRPGTHITAMGSDTAAKQELDPWILARADLVVADSISQCLLRGEISHAIQGGLLNEADLVELGCVVSGRARGRTAESQITVADLTGVAVQDIQIASLVYEAANERARSLNSSFDQAIKN